jgi:hypothetical protein
MLLINILIKLLQRKGGIAMVDVYIALIIYKLRTIDQVPKNLRPAVLAELNALGLDGYGNPLEAKK